MTKAQLIAPGSPPALKLRALAKEINELTAAIDISVERVKEGISIALTNGILTGHALIAAKKVVPHGQWLNWLAAHCPTITHRTATRYMTIARKADQIKGAKSIRQATFLLSDRGDDTTTGKKRDAQKWPVFVEVVRRLSKALVYASKHNPKDWPAEAKDEYRKKLEKAVAETGGRIEWGTSQQTVDVQAVVSQTNPQT